MTNSKRGEVEVELDGETLVMVFKYDTLMAIEEALGGRSIDELFLSGNISRTALAEGVRCGLEKRYRKKTRRQVAKMIGNSVDADEHAFKRISRAVIVGVLTANGASKEQIEELDRAIAEDDEGEMQAIADGKKDDVAEDPTSTVALTSTG